MKKRVRVFLLIGQILCILSASGFAWNAIFQGLLQNLGGLDPTSNLFWIAIIGFVELPFAIIGLLQAFKPSNKFMIWPTFVSLAFSLFMIYQTIVGMQVAIFFMIAMIPNLLINLGTTVMLILALVKGFQEKKTLKGAPAIS